MHSAHRFRYGEKIVLAVLAVIAVLVVGVVASSYLNTHDCCTTTSYSLSSSSSYTTSATSSASAFAQTTSATDSTNVLELRLFVNTTSSATGISASVFADAYNPTSSTANVTSGEDYVVSLTYADGAICGDDTYAQNPIVGFAIAEGYYTSSNITEAKFLDLVNPGVTYSCSLYLGYANPTGFLFQPMSDMATSYGCNQQMCMSGSASTDISAQPVTGYWTQGGVLISFPNGTYTVLAEDEWGTLVLAYFTVPQPPSFAASVCYSESIPTNDTTAGIGIFNVTREYDSWTWSSTFKVGAYTLQTSTPQSSQHTTYLWPTMTFSVTDAGGLVQTATVTNFGDWNGQTWPPDMSTEQSLFAGNVQIDWLFLCNSTTVLLQVTD